MSFFSAPQCFMYTSLRKLGFVRTVHYGAKFSCTIHCSSSSWKGRCPTQKFAEVDIKQTPTMLQWSIKVNPAKWSYLKLKGDAG